MKRISKDDWQAIGVFAGFAVSAFAIAAYFLLVYGGVQ